MIHRHLKATYLEGLPERPPAKVQQKRIDKQPQLLPPPPLVPEVAEVEKKTYLVTVHDMKLLDMHKNKRNKVFPLYSAVRISMFGFEFSSGRCCSLYSLCRFYRYWYLLQTMPVQVNH